MHWEVTSVDRAALGGKAVRKELTIWFTVKKDGPKMHLLVYQPIGAGAIGSWTPVVSLCTATHGSARRHFGPAPRTSGSPWSGLTSSR